MAQFEAHPSHSPPTYNSTFGVDPSANLCSRCTQASSSQQPRPEIDLIQTTPGWPSLAKLVTDNPGFEAFQSFHDLNIKMLLYYQAELHQLRVRLHKQEWKDLRDHGQRALCEGEVLNESIEHLLESKYKPPNTLARRQFDLVTEIREVLEKYNNALIQYSQITALPKAESFNVTTMRKWIKADPVSFKISGAGSQSWGDIDPTAVEPQEEPTIASLFIQFQVLIFRLFWPKKEGEDELHLIVPRCDHKTDGFTRWVGSEWVPFVTNSRKWWKERKILPSDLEKAVCGVRWRSRNGSQEPTCSCKKDSVPPPTLNTFSERRMLQFTSAVAIIIACALPIVAITVLSQLRGNGELLGTIAIFTIAFTSGLLFVGGGARRVDVFTATAAFSAVMVVFVQNQNQGGVPCQPCVGT